MRYILSVVLSPIYYFFYTLWLVLFDIIQRISLKLGGYSAHKKSVDVLQWLLIQSHLILGNRTIYTGHKNFPTDVPILVVSNHQSMHDISPLGWMFRKNHPKYVSKIELGKGIPSVSYNLNHGGSVLIDRKDGKQSIKAILGFGKEISSTNRCAVIFPEGTRSRTGAPRSFAESGLKMLIKVMPNCLVVPVTLNNFYKLNNHGGFPMPVGLKLTLHAHEPLRASEYEFKELFDKIETTIKSDIK